MDAAFDFSACPALPGVVAEGARWVVVRKPAGMPSVPAGRGGGSATLAAWLGSARPDCETAGRPGEAGLLQRLDGATSGLVLAAKDPEAFASLSRAAASLEFRKGYLLACAPSARGLDGSRPALAAPGGVDAAAWEAAALKADSGALAALAAAARDGGRVEVGSRFRGFGPGGARVACLAEGADPGRSGEWTRDRYRTLVESLRDDGAGRLAGFAVLARGFRHQVRAHFAWMGLPLVGDEVYGGVRAGRLMLHAALLEFPDPDGGGRVRIADPLVAGPLPIV